MSKFAPVHDITTDKVVKRRKEILKICKKQKVLHVGCTDSPYTEERGSDLLHVDIDNHAKELWGIDPSCKGCRALKKMGFNNIIEGYLDAHVEKLNKKNFDIILAGEVIEHVYNVGHFLDNIYEIMNSKSELIITTINTPSLRSFIFALLRKEKVHPDHNYYFSHETLKTLLGKAGFGDVSMYYYNTENNIIDKILSASTHISPVLSDGLFVRARTGGNKSGGDC